MQEPQSAQTLSTEQAETYRDRWQRLQDDNPAAFSLKFVIPARILLVVLIVWLIKLCESNLPQIGKNECLVDYMHNHTSGMNKQLQDNKTLALTMQGFYTVLLDLSFQGYMTFWMIKGRSMRLVMSLVLFYLIKIMMDASIILTAPANMIWYPSVVPSVLIRADATYNFTCAFACGIYMILFQDCLMNKGGIKFAFLFLLLNILTIWYSIVAQINWTSDLVSGQVSGSFAFICAQFIAENWLDKKIARSYDWGDTSEKTIAQSEMKQFNYVN